MRSSLHKLVIKTNRSAQTRFFSVVQMPCEPPLECLLFEPIYHGKFGHATGGKAGLGSPGVGTVVARLNLIKRHLGDARPE